MFWFESIWSSFRCQSLQYSLLRLRWCRRKSLVRNSIPESKWSEDPDDHCYWLHHQLFPLKSSWNIRSFSWFCFETFVLMTFVLMTLVFVVWVIIIICFRLFLSLSFNRESCWWASSSGQKYEVMIETRNKVLVHWMDLWDFEWYFEEESRTRDNRLRRGLSEYKGS